MTRRCSICGKTALEKIEELARAMMSPDSLSMSVNETLVATLCEDCQEVYRLVVPAILEEIGILKYDEKTGYKLAIK